MSLFVYAARTWAVSFSRDSKTIATGTYSGTVDIYDASTGVCIFLDQHVLKCKSLPKMSLIARVMHLLLVFVVVSVWTLDFDRMPCMTDDTNTGLWSRLN